MTDMLGQWQVFVYTPGMYSSSNQDFVRGTVTSFYEMFKQVSSRRNGEDGDDDDFRAFAFNGTDSGDEMVCPMDDMEWELKVRNQAMKRGCASVQMNGLKIALMMVRKVVDTIVTIYFDMMQLAMCLFKLMIPSSSGISFEETLAEITFWFNKIITSIIEVVKQMANLVFDLVFTLGPLGSAMKTIIEFMCKIIQIILWIWNETACKFLIKPIIVPVIRIIARIIAKIVYFFKLNDAVLDMMFEIVNYLAKIKCNETISCSYPTPNPMDPEFGALPVASRCWADFNPEIDTSNSFSCTASDTCRVAEFTYGESIDEFGQLVEDGNQIVCDSCPLQPGGLVNQYGCDTYTKQCTCNRWGAVHMYAS
jgi:hypothetical protein